RLAQVRVRQAAQRGDVADRRGVRAQAHRVEIGFEAAARGVEAGDVELAGRAAEIADRLFRVVDRNLHGRLDDADAGASRHLLDGFPYFTAAREPGSLQRLVVQLVRR